jgi:AcrR family transcriptional regulator
MFSNRFRAGPLSSRYTVGSFSRADLTPSLPVSWLVSRTFTEKILEKTERSCYFLFMSKGQSTRSTILDQAISTATQLGLEALSIGTLAKQTGLSKSGLFAHFSSKENLQISVLETAVERFTRTVIAPAIPAPRGEPRIRAIFENWIRWETSSLHPGGCPFISVSSELDDRPGPVRDFLVKSQRDFVGALARSARLAVEEGHFRGDLEPEQFAFEIYGLVLSFHFFHRLLQDPQAETRLRRSFEGLIVNCRPSVS